MTHFDSSPSHLYHHSLLLPKEMSFESAISLRVPSTSPVRASSLPPSAPSTSPSPELEVPADYKYIGADHCGVCCLPLKYDHITWSRGLIDGYSCQCSRTSSSEPSPPDNTPEGTLTPQLGRRTLPMPEDNDDEDSEVNYDDPEEADKENQRLAPPPDFINNIPNHPFFYHIYVRNPQYTANQSNWAKERLIVAPYIKYSANYTHVEGSAGVGTETQSCPVQIDRRVHTHAPMNPVKWRHLRNGSDWEFTINMALAQLNDPTYYGEVNHYRGLSNLQDTLERLMREAQGHVMEVMKELVNVDAQLKLCKNRLEISNVYEELDRQYRLVNPVPICPHHATVQSPLVEAPRVVRAIVPLPSRPRGPVEMSILQDADPHHHVTRCYRCKKIGHVASQCHTKKRSRKCTICGGTHKPAKCLAKARTASPEAVAPVFGKVIQREEMSLLECILLLDHIKYSPSHCAKCGRQNLEHLEMECPMYKQCLKYYCWGPRGFILRHSCRGVSEVSWGANADYYEEDWYQGHD